MGVPSVRLAAVIKLELRTGNNPFVVERLGRAGRLGIMKSHGVHPHDMKAQGGILPDVPDHSCYLEFRLLGDAQAALAALASLAVGDDVVIGVGQPLLQTAGKSIDGLKVFPELPATQASAPATQLDLWVWCRGGNAGAVGMASSP
jgi:deferrochelatase/peroxidase EfeB